MALTLADMRKKVKPLDDEEQAEAAENHVTPRNLTAITELSTASPLQTAIFEHVDSQVRVRKNGLMPTNLAVEAVAGSGKTTTIIAASNILPRDWSCLFLAFNKDIAEELGDRLPKHVKTRTLNALGMSITGRYLKSIGVTDVFLDRFRTSKIITSLLGYKKSDLLSPDIQFLVQQCKSLGVVPVGCTDGEGIGGAEATDELFTKIGIHHGRMVDPLIRAKVYAETRRVLALSWSDSNVYSTNCIDYDDQKWFAVCKRPMGKPMTNPIYDSVTIDEVQDVNAVDIALIRMVAKPNALIIGVGDSNQAIYGFRGADTKAFEAFKTDFATIALPLSITYRCSNALVKYAQELVPEIQAAPSASAGAVDFLSEYEPSIFQPGDMVVCRNNAPLIEFAYKLIAARVPVYVKGREIGTQLTKLITRIAGEKKWVPNPNKPGKKKPEWTVEDISVTILAQRLSEWQDTQVALIEQEEPDNYAALQGVTDCYECLMLFVDDNTDGKALTVIADIESLFSNDDHDDKVCCATIHKSKGLEAERVFMYQPKCLYPVWVEKDTWQGQQERNLDYVARTRGKSYYGILAGSWKDSP